MQPDGALQSFANLWRPNVDEREIRERESVGANLWLAKLVSSSQSIAAGCCMITNRRLVCARLGLIHLARPTPSQCEPTAAVAPPDVVVVNKRASARGPKLGTRCGPRERLFINQVASRFVRPSDHVIGERDESIDCKPTLLNFNLIFKFLSLLLTY